MRLPARRIALLLVCMLPALAACSRTIEWEEEVALDSGETLWVRRADSFERRTEPGNPLKPAWWPTARHYRFDYQGHRYDYGVAARDSPGALALRVGADGSVSIIDFARNCNKPGFAEWRWSGTAWTVVPEVSPALYGTRRNLMALRSPEGDIPSRVSTEKKQRLDGQPGTKHVDELHSSTAASGCGGRI